MLRLTNNIKLNEFTYKILSLFLNRRGSRTPSFLIWITYSSLPENEKVHFFEKDVKSASNESKDIEKLDYDKDVKPKKHKKDTQTQKKKKNNKKQKKKKENKHTDTDTYKTKKSNATQKKRKQTKKRFQINLAG